MKLRVALKVLAHEWFRDIDRTRVPHYSDATFARAFNRWILAWPDANTPRRISEPAKKGKT